MTKKRIALYAVVALLLVALFYLQFRTWRGFDWAVFLAQTRQVQLIHILLGIAFTYLAYVMRALRWRIFLRPVKQTMTMRLLSPTIVGFTGLSLLGRPGELIRPYLIARRENLSFSSQLAAWAVERIFDIGAFTFLLLLTVFFARAPRRLADYHSLREAGLVLTALSVGLPLAAIAA